MNESAQVMSLTDQENNFASTQTSSQALKARHHGAMPRQIVNDEALRLVQQVFLAQAEETPRVVVFAGIDHGSGCSQVCASVSETLARTSRRPVCIVDANFRSPMLSTLFQTANRVGLSDALVGEGTIQSYTEKVATENLWLLSSGNLTKDSSGMLNSDRLRDRLVELRGEFEYVIIDAPPLTQYSDAIALAQLSDGLVLILEADATRRDAATVAAANLRAVNIPILAAVLNKRSFPIPEALYKRL